MQLPSKNTHLISTLETLDHVSTKKQFIHWTKTELRQSFPHGAFMACIGKVLKFGVKPVDFVSTNFPATYLAETGGNQIAYRPFMLQRWLHSEEPQLFDLQRDAALPGVECTEAFSNSGLQNIAAHGLFDIGRQHVSFFSFHQLPSPPGHGQGRFLKLLVPALHAAFLRCIQVAPSKAPSRTSPPVKELTQREREVLHWICAGKSNPEIATILQISPNTVKNQTQSILIKLRVNTRAQAASEAIRRRLVA